MSGISLDTLALAQQCAFFFVNHHLKFWGKDLSLLPQEAPTPPPVTTSHEVTGTNPRINMHPQCGSACHCWETCDRVYSQLGYILVVWVGWPTKSSKPSSHQWALKRFRPLPASLGLAVKSVFFFNLFQRFYLSATKTEFLQNLACLWIDDLGLKSSSWFKAGFSFFPAYIFLLFITITPKEPQKYC